MLFLQIVENSLRNSKKEEGCGYWYNKNMTTLHHSLGGLDSFESRVNMGNSIVDQALRLCKLVEDKGMAACSALTRPRLEVATAGRQVAYDINVCAEDGQLFCLSKNGTLLLTTDAHNPATSYQTHLQVGLPASTIGAFLQNDANMRAFLLARGTLAQACWAIENNAPMDAGRTWAQSFERELGGVSSMGPRRDVWERWLTQWGTPEMQSCMDVADGLADARQDFGQWKSIVLAGWQGVESKPLVEDVSTLFDCSIT